MRPVEESKLWYLARLKPNCAQIAKRNLERQGFEVFVPLERQSRRRGSQFIDIERPFFPGYLFVSDLTDSAHWRTIRSTYGIAQLVSFGSIPATVPTEIISQLKASCDKNSVIRSREALTRGDNVRISAGPFVDFVGRVERLNPDQRAWILLDILGKQTRVALPLSELQLTS